MTSEDTASKTVMAELLETVKPMKALRRGEVVDGMIMRVDTDGILINMGQKQEGVIPASEMRTLPPEALKRLHVGSQVAAIVLKTGGDDNAAVLSLDKARDEMGWGILEKCLESGKPAEGRIIGFNRGGALVDVEGVQGFIPMSQLVSVNREVLEKGAENGGKESIGHCISVKVLELDRKRNRAIFSEKSAVQEQREEQKQRLVDELSEGAIVKGKITGISSFGAFVDLGGADGLIHISELSWETVQKPESVVKIGDEVEVYVLKVDKEAKKISLSLRRTKPTPWDTVNERYQVGQIVPATITKLTNFGAFARIENGVEGLIHISELTDRIIKHPKEAVSEGDEVTVKVLRIEPERRRLGLSLKQAGENV